MYYWDKPRILTTIILSHAEINIKYIWIKIKFPPKPNNQVMVFR